MTDGGAYRVTRAELDASPDRPDTAPDFRKVNHFHWSWADEMGQLWIPALFVMAELSVLLALAVGKR